MLRKLEEGIFVVQAGQPLGLGSKPSAVMGGVGHGVLPAHTNDGEIGEVQAPPAPEWVGRISGGLQEAGVIPHRDQASADVKGSQADLFPGPPRRPDLVHSCFTEFVVSPFQGEFACDGEITVAALLASKEGSHGVTDPGTMGSHARFFRDQALLGAFESLGLELDLPANSGAKISRTFL
jgi:hypothetical protein